MRPPFSSAPFLLSPLFHNWFQLAPSPSKHLQAAFLLAFHFTSSLRQFVSHTMAPPLPRSPETEASSTRLPSEQPQRSPTPGITAPDSPPDFDMLEEQSEVERSPPEQAKGPVVNIQDSGHRSETNEIRSNERRRTSKPPRRMKVPWSQDEEEKLLREVRDHGKDWVGIRDEDIAGPLMFFIACAYNVSDLSIY